MRCGPTWKNCAAPSPEAVPKVIAEGPSWAMVDGHSAMAMVSACKGMELAIAKAKQSGVGYVGVKM